MEHDLYKILGVSKSASDEEIKKAYRKLSKQHHPDLNKGNVESEKKFKQISAAYEILSDKQKRMQYDQFGGVPGAGGFGGGGGFQSSGFDFNSAFGGGFADIFESFFNQGQGGSQRSGSQHLRGSDLEINIQITFEEAIFGTTKEITITKFVACGKCKGIGAEPGSGIINCKTCNGTGEVTTIQNTFLGQMRSSHICSTCSGTGKIPEKICQQCNGEGRLKERSTIKVNIPAGVDSGTTLRMTGQGNSGSKGEKNGDLYINIMVQESKKFIRKGIDIHTNLNIHLLQAVLGDEMEIETIQGKRTLKIPAGTMSGTVLRLKEYGIQKINSSQKGDHHIKIEVEIPKKLAPEEKNLYTQLAEIAKKKEKGFWGKLFN